MNFTAVMCILFGLVIGFFAGHFAGYAAGVEEAETAAHKAVENMGMCEWAKSITKNYCTK